MHGIHGYVNTYTYAYIHTDEAHIQMRRYTSAYDRSATHRYIYMHGIYRYVNTYMHLLPAQLLRDSKHGLTLQ